MNNDRKQRGLLHLIRWVVMPTKPTELFHILEGLREDELILAATKIKGLAGRIAWAEFARRAGYFNFEVSVATGGGKLEVVFDAKGAPVHAHPQFS
jgi:hypothetical protein